MVLGIGFSLLLNGKKVNAQQDKPRQVICLYFQFHDKLISRQKCPSSNLRMRAEAAGRQFCGLREAFPPEGPLCLSRSQSSGGALQIQSIQHDTFCSRTAGVRFAAHASYWSESTKVEYLLRCGKLVFSFPQHSRSMGTRCRSLASRPMCEPECVATTRGCTANSLLISRAAG